jgi:subtilase family serine protease
MGKDILPLLFLLILILGTGVNLIIANSEIEATYIGPTTQANFIGYLPQSDTICIGILIPPKNLNLLYLSAQEVAFHQIKQLSREELISMFAQTEKEQEIINYLESKGFTIVYKSPFALIAEGTVNDVESAFNVKLGLYESNNGIFYKAVSDPTLPSFFSGVLIQGLSNYTNIYFETNTITLGKIINGKLVLSSPFNFSGYLSFAANMYSPQDIIGAYNITQGGKGTTIAIIDAYGDPTIYQDLQAFDKKFDLPLVNLTVVPIGPYHPIFGLFTGWYLETALDVETAHAISPYAKIVLVVPSSPVFIPEAIDYIVTNDIANVTSMSFGIPENVLGDTGFYFVQDGVLYPNLPYWDYYFELGTAEGITFLAASGDEGATAGGLTTYGGVSYPATSPFVTAVGGTTLFVNVTSGYLSMQNSTATYGYETAWSTDGMFFFPYVASDGGYSTYYPKPWYQYSLNGTTRAVPDVAADANPYTGEIIYALGVETVIGGTSLATPIWAGMVSDIISVTNKPVGLLNNILYWIYSNTTLYNQVFHQITLGYNGLYSANKGYNLVTGLGSVDWYGLLKAVEEYESIPKLSISVTATEPGVQYPWFMYNTTFSILAKVSYPNDTIVTSGGFTAYIYSTEGLVGEVPLIYNGSYWIGTFTIKAGMSPNIWLIVVNGTSGKYSGSGVYEIDVGLSIDIIEPIPFPYAASIPPNQPFTVEACIYYPNLTPVNFTSFTAQFILNGKDEFNVTLLPTSTPGLYKGSYALIPPTPEGVYVMVINDTYGNAYLYETLGGLNLIGLVFTPIDDGFPSIAPGENITVLAFTFDQNGLAIFTSNVYVFIYNPQGKLIGKLNTTLATEATQFGVYDLFGFHEVNYTIPRNATPGFYKVVMEGWYNSSIGIEEMNYTDYFYVAPANAVVHINGIKELIQGEYIKVLANITYPNGTPITEGLFTVTLEPLQLINEQIFLEFSYGLPMQYNSTLHEWVALVQVPGITNNISYPGAPVYAYVGPWKVAIVGNSFSGYTVPSYGVYTYIQPYIYMPTEIITNSNISQIPFIAGNTMNNVYINKLELNGVSLVIQNSEINNLIIKGGSVTIIDSKIGSIEAQNATVKIIGSEIVNGGVNAVNSNIDLVSTVFENTTYAYNLTYSNVTTEGVNYINVEEMSLQPSPTISYEENITTTVSNITLTITNPSNNSNIIAIKEVELDGKPVSYMISKTSSGVKIVIPFNSAQEPPGSNTITLVFSDGIEYHYTLQINNEYPIMTLNSSISNLKIISISLGIVGIILALIALILILRKGKGVRKE